MNKNNIFFPILILFDNYAIIYFEIYFTLQPTILQPLIPPILLDSKSFRRVYKTKIDVLDANDLLLSPTQEAPCINVHTQDLSRYDTAQ